MENLMRAIDKVLSDKETSILILKLDKERLEREVAELRKEITELKIDIEKYKENEVNRI